MPSQLQEQLELATATYDIRRQEGDYICLRVKPRGREADEGFQGVSFCILSSEQVTLVFQFLATHQTVFLPGVSTLTCTHTFQQKASYKAPPCNTCHQFTSELYQMFNDIQKQQNPVIFSSQKIKVESCNQVSIKHFIICTIT